MNAQYIKLSMIPSGVMPTLYVSQYDVGRPLGFIVTNGTEVVDMDSYTVTVEATRSDGVPITAAVTTTDNIGVFETTATMTNVAGSYKAQLVIAIASGKRIASIPFVMKVTAAAMDENSEGIAEDQSLYQQYTGTVQSLIATIRTQLNAEIANRQTAVSAEATARQTADNTLQSNINSEASARAAAVSAEATARQSADNTLQSNINAEASTRATQDASLQSQIDQIIAPSGEAPSAAEVENARIGADGVTYPTLGDAIRTQDSNLKNALTQNLPIYKTRFSVAQGVAHSSTADTISINIQANEKFALRWDSTLSSQYVQIVALYADGTSTRLVDAQTQNVNRYTEYTATNNIVKIGVYSTAQSSAYTFELAVATQSIGMEFLDLLKNNTVANQENLISAQGIVKTEFSVDANASHSSTLDQRVVDIHAGEEFSIYSKTTFNGNLYTQIYVVYADNTSEKIYDGNVAVTGYYGTFTASKAIKAIAYYTVSKTSAYTFTAFVCTNINLKGLLTSMLDSTYASVESVEELERSENIRSIKFDVASGASHSSATDMLPFSISAGDVYSVHLRFDMENVPFNAYMQVNVTYADGTTAHVVEGNYPSIMLSEKLIAAKAIVRFGVYVGSQANAYSCILSVARGQNAVDIFHTVYGERYDLLQTLTDSKVQSFSALYNGSESVDSYIFFTDPHAMPGANVLTKPKLDTLDAYLQTVEEYAEAIDADTVLCGGDWLNNGDTQAVACYKLRLLKGMSDKHFAGYNYHMLLGNHDTNYQGKQDSDSAANTGQLTQATIDNLLYADTNTGKAYYRFDTVNTTYLCLDTGLDWSTAMDAYRWEQIAWLCGQLLTTTKANIIIAMHIFANQGTVETYTDHITPMATNVVSAIEAYNNRGTVVLNGQNYNFSEVTGVVRCVLTGHTHFDAVYTTTGGIPVVFTTDATDYAVSPIMFDMGFLNYTAGTLSIFRIGEGSDRTVTLATLA